MKPNNENMSYSKTITKRRCQYVELHMSQEDALPLGKDSWDAGRATTSSKSAKTSMEEHPQGKPKERHRAVHETQEDSNTSY